MNENGQHKKQRNRSSTLTPEQTEWAYRQWCSGYTIQEIANKLYVSPAALYRSFKGRRRQRAPLKLPENE